MGTVEPLNLALLVDTEHQRSIERVQMKTHDIVELLDELRILARLNVFTRWGLSPCALQIRCKAAGLILWAWPLFERSNGSRSEAWYEASPQPPPEPSRWKTRWTTPRQLFLQGLRPALRKTLTPKQHRGRETPCSFAIAWLAFPSVALSTVLLRGTMRCCIDGARTQLLSCSTCSDVAARGSLAAHMRS